VIYLGTSGFSYNDWVGPFYPEGMPKREWLRYYARQFNSCEVNATFYTVPKPATLISMANKTGEGFLFVIKANQRMTHEQRDNEDVFKAFAKMVCSLAERGKMGCVLAQFPYGFRFNRKNRDYLEIFRERLADLPIVIEFRNAQWLKQELFDWLRRNELGFCCVDEPQLPDLLAPLAAATSKVAYVRFHGCNAEKWWNHKQAYERYDYSYSPEELADWLPKIRGLDRIAEKNVRFRQQSLARTGGRHHSSSAKDAGIGPLALALSSNCN